MLLISAATSLLMTPVSKAEEGTIFRMKCGAAGLVTARLKQRIPRREQYFYTDIYSEGLNVGIKNLPGLAGASHFSVDDDNIRYDYFPGSMGSPEQLYSFAANGKKYNCTPVRD